MSPAETVESIAAYLGRFADLGLAEVERFVAKGKSRVLEPGDSFCRLGQRTHEVAFIQAGIVRYMISLPDGNESTKDFSFKGSFTVSFGSAALQRPAEVAIAAVVRTELLVWPYQVLLDLYDSNIEWQKVGRRIAEFLYVRKEQRELSFLLLDAEARYRQMRAQFGPQADAIPQYHLASYLGMRPQSLSRLKKRIADAPG
ncbi:MAG: Crp/Fnr family transcriptional regulator [Micropepsaceae bacterium]